MLLTDFIHLPITKPSALARIRNVCCPYHKFQNCGYFTKKKLQNNHNNIHTSPFKVTAFNSVPLIGPCGTEIYCPMLVSRTALLQTLNKPFQGLDLVPLLHSLQNRFCNRTYCHCCSMGWFTISKG